ncbi:alpha/beta hydrolase [Desulfacinum infernum]|nr:alpha/beta hydrolase [Desulfacinum infernum]
MWVETSFGRVEAWFLPSRRPGPDGKSPLIVYAHGNGEVIDIWPSVLEPLAHRGLSVLLVEYPGYGRSEGKPSQKSITESFVAAYDRVAGRPDVDSERIFLWGRSIGGGAVCALAAQRPSAGLLLMSTFTSLRPFARRYLAPSFLVRDPFDNLDVVRRYPNPVLVVHGRNDTVIPYRHGVDLARNAPNARLITYDCDHNDCPPRWPPFFRILEDFVRGKTDSP